MKKITKPSDTVLIDPNEPLILPDGTALVGRVEWFLYALCCLDYQNLPTPMSRIEEFANALITGEIPNIEPQSRAEQFFLAILDGNVSNLPKPQSRSEVLLDKLARGEFDLSDVEPIQSRYELLLAYLIKNGGIGNIDYVLYEFSEAMKTMYNTVEKPFKSLELSGNTKVNVLQESVEDDNVVPYQVDECQGATLTGTKETGSLDNLVINGRTLVNSVLEDTSSSDYVSFDKDYSGKSFTIENTVEGAISDLSVDGKTLVNYIQEDTENDDYVSFNEYYSGQRFTVENTAEGAIQNAILRGQTLVNLADRNVFSKGGSGNGDVVNTGTSHKITITKRGSMVFTYKLNQPLKNGKKYLLYAPYVLNTSTSVPIYGSFYNGSNFTKDMDKLIDCKYMVLTPTESETYTRLVIGYHSHFEVDDVIEITYPILLEYEDGMEKNNWNHFDYMKSVTMPVLHTIGKNLFDVSLTENTNGKVTFIGYKENGDKEAIKVTDINAFLEKGKTYTFSCKSDGTFGTVEGTDTVECYLLKDKKYSVVQSLRLGNTFTCQETGYYYLRFDVNKGDATHSFWDIQLEEGSVATAYEPYMSNTLSCDEEVILRGINGVQDTLNCRTGEITERIGESVLNGGDNEQWSLNKQLGDNYYQFVYHVGKTISSERLVVCDKLPSSIEESRNNVIWIYNGTTFVIHSSLNSASSLKTWLQSNPLTVQYKLKESITKTVDTSIVDKNNNKVNNIHVFNGKTHVQCLSDELTPIVDIDKSVSYKAILKPSTDYTIITNRTNIPTTSNLTFNVGGQEVTFTSDETRKTITTSSTLTNDTISYYGLGHKVNGLMLLEGNTTEELDYFIGMKSVKLPVLSTIGKNLLDFEKTQIGYLGGNPHGLNAPDQNNKTSDYIRVKPNTTYTYSFDGFTASQVGNEYWTGWYYYTSPTEVSKKNMNRKVARGSADTFKTVTFTTPSDCYYVRIGSRGLALSGAIAQLEEGSTATSYEPYKSNILTVNEDVELGSVSDVRDTLDCMTGEIIEKTKFISINGSENGWSVSELSDTIKFTNNSIMSDAFYQNGLTVGSVANKFICSSIQLVESNLSQEATKQQIGYHCHPNNRIELRITILKTNLESLDIDGFKKWISKNGLEITYILNQESIKTVALNVVDQSNTKIDKIHVFNEVTHVNASSDELTPTVNISKSVSYPTIIKPNTKYTVDLKRNDKPLTVNLGGTEVTFASGETRKVITTPSTLTNDKLSYYGMGQKCSGIMVFEGEIEGNVDYFTGMQNVKTPIVKTIGKNLFNISTWSGATGVGCGLIAIDGENVTLTSSRRDAYSNTGSVTSGQLHPSNIKHSYECKENTMYMISCSTDKAFTNGLITSSYVFFFDKNYNALSYKQFQPIGTIITSPKNAKYFTLRVGFVCDTVPTTVTFSNIQVEEVSSTSSTKTDYQSYKANILSTLDDVNLRSLPNKVKDTLNLGNGEYIQRISETVLNSDTIINVQRHVYSDNYGDGNFSFFICSMREKGVIYKHCISDKLIGDMNSAEYMRGLKYSCIGGVDNSVYIWIKRSELSEDSSTGMMNWLNENQVKVQGTLINPIVRKIDLSIIDHNNISQTKLHTFNDVTHITTSGDKLTPIIKCDGKLEYPVVIKPSTQYTILASTSANAHALNNIAFDLGGAKVTNTFGTRKITVTTPSTLTNNSLTITNEGSKLNELMVLEGNESDTVPYFEGMSSYKMSTLSTTGKNVFKLRQAEELAGWGSHDFKLLDNGFSFNAKSGWNSVAYSFPNLKNKTVTVTANVLCNVISNDKAQSQTVGIGNYKYNPNGSIVVDNGHNNRMSFTFTVLDDGLIWFYGSSNPEGSQYGNSPVKWLFTDIQVEEGTQSTTYEPYKSSILSCNEDVTLRGIGDIQDTLNVANGEVVECINKVTFDGSDDESWTFSEMKGDNYRFGLNLKTDVYGSADTTPMLCDKWVVGNIQTEPTQEQVMIYNHTSYMELRLTISPNKLTSNTGQALKDYLKANPFTMQYALRTPIVKTVDLSIVDQDGNAIPKIKSYKDMTHLEVTVPKQSLLPNISAEVATDNSKDMSLLTTKHQEISEAQSAIQNSIQSQSDEIDTAMMATTEIFESILE